MLRFVLLVTAIASVAVAYRLVALQCGRKPALRRRFIAGGLCTFCVAALLVPWVLAKLKPPLSESPAGVFVILGKLVVVGSLGLGAIGTIIGAALAERNRDSD